jgi:hypothetical protein
MTIALPRTFPTPKIDWTPIPPPMSLDDIMAGKFRGERPIPAKPPKPELGHMELKVLRRMVGGCKMRRVAGHWALSISADDKVKGYCKVRQGAVNRLVEGGYVAAWGDRLSLTGKGSALMGKGSVARIA